MATMPLTATGINTSRPVRNHIINSMYNSQNSLPHGSECRGGWSAGGEGKATMCQNASTNNKNSQENFKKIRENSPKQHTPVSSFLTYLPRLNVEYKCPNSE